MSIINKINARLKKVTCAHVHLPQTTREFCPDPEIPIYETEQLMQCRCGDEYWTVVNPTKKAWRPPWKAPMKAGPEHRYIIGNHAATGEIKPTLVTVGEAKYCGESYTTYKECLKAINQQHERFQRNNRES